MSVDFNTSQLSQLAQDLGRLGSPEFAENLLPAMKSTAALVKATWNAKLYTEGHADRTGNAITYDVGVGDHSFDLFATEVGDARSTILAEIGARTGSGRQAGVVRLLENGSVHNAPHGYGAASLHEHESDFEAALAFAEAAAAGRWNL
jgi:hypothetical protein